VLCPGLNDGEQLDRSISDLASLYPHVQTVGVVPVGLTRYRRNSHYQIKTDIRTYLPGEAEAVIEQVEAWQRRLRSRAHSNFVYLSDEWYIMSGQTIPAAKEYEGYSQLENGIGMVRQLLDEGRKTSRKITPALDKPVSALMVSGEMAADYITRAFEPLRSVGGLDLHLLPVKNNTLGGNVSCSGLLFGEEVVNAIRQHEEQTERTYDVIFLPRRMFDFQGVRTLDEWTFDRFQSELQRPVVAAEWTKDVWHTVQRASRGEDCYTRQSEPIRFTALG
jgi:NifB/MoaA-like Fe-S oxidoreductase